MTLAYFCTVRSMFKLLQLSEGSRVNNQVKWGLSLCAEKNQVNPVWSRLSNCIPVTALLVSTCCWLNSKSRFCLWLVYSTCTQKVTLIIICTPGFTSPYWTPCCMKENSKGRKIKALLCCCMLWSSQKLTALKKKSWIYNFLLKRWFEMWSKLSQRYS